MNRFIALLTLSAAVGLSHTAYSAEGQSTSELWRHAMSGNVAGVMTILERGGDVNHASPTGMTPLMWAVQEGNQELIDLLLDKGADVNAFNHRAGCNALILAGEWLQPQNVEALIQRGAQVNYQSRLGWTALLKSVRVVPRNFEERTRQLAVVKTLLANGADVKVRADKGATPLILAAKSGNKALLELLLDYRAEIDAQDKGGNTALMWAAKLGHLEAVNLLLAHHASVSKNHVCGCTALLLASEQGHDQVVQALLDHQSDIHAKNEDGMTALMFAAQKGHLKTVSLLFERGARVNDMNNHGATARLLAIENRHDEVEQFLQAAGGRCF
ncbi:MAG: ankyrin repeat domain-containing protein [Magnetococcales bacterium]|nr:ankyrin repeat domain-containing protein [Magnetococcales bacterium]